MGRCTALYSSATRAPAPRTRLELARDTLLLTFPDGRLQSVALHGCRFRMGDAAHDQRFVRRLILDKELPHLHVELITPPDEGAIAPRAAGLPVASDQAAVVESTAWETLVEWIRGGGRLGGRTVAELARLCRVATPQFAVIIGEIAAQAAVEAIWEQCGPMRDSGGMIYSLRPLEEAARTSPRAADALMAALAAVAMLRRTSRRR